MGDETYGQDRYSVVSACQNWSYIAATLSYSRSECCSHAAALARSYSLLGSPGSMSSSSSCASSLQRCHLSRAARAESGSVIGSLPVVGWVLHDVFARLSLSLLQRRTLAPYTRSRNSCISAGSDTSTWKRSGRSICVTVLAGVIAVTLPWREVLSRPRVAGRRSCGSAAGCWVPTAAIAVAGNGRLSRSSPEGRASTVTTYPRHIREQPRRVVSVRCHYCAN